MIWDDLLALDDRLLGNPVKAKDVPLLFPEHHLSHGASAFYPSPFEDAAILTIDGVGEWRQQLFAMEQEKTSRLLKNSLFPHSVGLLYSAFTYYCGFKVNSGEYKLMGLAPYELMEVSRLSFLNQSSKISSLTLNQMGLSSLI